MVSVGAGVKREESDGDVRLVFLGNGATAGAHVSLSSIRRRKEQLKKEIQVSDDGYVSKYPPSD
jgi:hypothetical protein